MIAHHEAVEASPGKSHIEVIKEYPNGGRDVITVWDEKPVAAKDAWDEKETIQRYIPYTDDELKNIEKQKEEERQQELIPTNADLSDAISEIAQGSSDIGDSLTELSTIIEDLQERVDKLENNNSSTETTSKESE